MPFPFTHAVEEFPGCNTVSLLTDLIDLKKLLSLNTFFVASFLIHHAPSSWRRLITEITTINFLCLTCCVRLLKSLHSALICPTFLQWKYGHFFYFMTVSITIDTTFAFHLRNQLVWWFVSHHQTYGNLGCCTSRFLLFSSCLSSS